MIKIPANTPIKLYQFSYKNYNQYALGVYLVWCEPKDSIQEAIILPILAPHEDCRNAQSNKIPNPYDAGYYNFSIGAYIKASAKTLAKKLNPDPKNPTIWKPDSYKFSSIRLNLDSLADCIDEGNRGESVDAFVSPYYSFHNMLANYFMDEGTLPVTFEALKEAEREVEEPITDDGLESKIAILAPPVTNAIN